MTNYIFEEMLLNLLTIFRKRNLPQGGIKLSKQFRRQAELKDGVGGG